MVGYGVYRILSRNVSLTAPRRALAAGIGGYVGLNAAALCAAIEFGVQPTLFHSANGTPLYAPFHLSHTIPAMALAHLTVAGAVEAGPDRRGHRLPAAGQPAHHADQPRRASGHRRRHGARPASWVGGGAGSALGRLVVLTPLGLHRPGGRFRGGRSRGSRPAEVPPRRRAERAAALRRVLAQRVVRRLRLHQRQAPDDRLPRLGRRRHRGHRRDHLRHLRHRRHRPCCTAIRAANPTTTWKPCTRDGDRDAPRAGCWRAKSGCARAAASASARRAASSRRPSAEPRA